jgi:hypothetical protein
MTVGFDRGEFDADSDVSAMAIWVSTVLHRKKPAVQETPICKGLLRYPKSMAEREGLPRRSQKPNKIRHFLQARGRRVYQSCVPKSMGFAPPIAQY